MWMLTRLLDPNNTQPISYLWEMNKILRDEKRAIVNNILGEEYIVERPDSDQDITWDITAVYSFIARENLECAFFCDPNTSIETVNDLCLIISRTIPEWQHVHITIHTNYQKVKTEWRNSSTDLLAYFEVTLKSEIQDEIEQKNNITEFINIYTQWLSNP